MEGRHIRIVLPVLILTCV